MLKKVLTASLLCGLVVWRGAAAPEGDARKAKWAERPKADEAQGPAGEAASTAEGPRPVAPAPGREKEWLQERWDGLEQKDWNGSNSYWKKTDVVVDFMPPYISPAYAWAARRELAMAEGSRFAVSSYGANTGILYGGVGTGASSNTGVVCYAEDREGATWKVSAVKDSGGFASKKVFDVCWTSKPTSGTIFAATGIASPRTTANTSLFSQRGVVPSSSWTSAPEYSSTIPPRTVCEFSAVAPEPAGANTEVYLGYSAASIGAAQAYRYVEPRTWELLGQLPSAKDVYALYTTETGFLAGTGPKGYVYEWNKNQSKFTPRPVGALTDGDIYDVNKIGDYYYAAAGNCAPGDKARLFRTRDLVQWEDVTPRATGASSLIAFKALSEFGKDGAVAALGDTFDRLYVSYYPAQANWGVVAGDAGAKSRDAVHVQAGSDFWGDFVGYEKEGLVYARKFQGFKSGGVLYSSVYDSFDKLVEYKGFSVEGPMASGGATFWLRAADDIQKFRTAEGYETGEPTWVAVVPGQPLPAELNNKRYIQYKVRFDVPDGQKFPPVVKKIGLTVLSTYSKVTATLPANGTKGHKVDVPMKFVFSKAVDWSTIGPENITITGANSKRVYRWYGFGNDPTCEYVVFHEDFERNDKITVKLESIPRREVLDKDGWEIDPDGDGQQGGTYWFEFGVGTGGGGGEGEGPEVYDVNVKPNPTFGAKKINITATADDTETGNSPIVAAEYSFGASPAQAGEGTPMEGEFGSPKVEVSAEADISEIVKGEKRLTVYVRAMDKPGNWGDPTAAPIFIRPPAFLPAEYVYFYPNPCRGEVGYFHYLVTQDSDVNVRIYDIRGRLVEEIKTTATAYSTDKGLQWDVSRVGADVYIFRFTARALATGEVATVTKKLAVLK